MCLFDRWNFQGRIQLSKVCQGTGSCLLSLLIVFSVFLFIFLVVIYFIMCLFFVWQVEYLKGKFNSVKCVRKLDSLCFLFWFNAVSILNPSRTCMQGQQLQRLKLMIGDECPKRPQFWSFSMIASALREACPRQNG